MRSCLSRLSISVAKDIWLSSCLSTVILLPSLQLLLYVAFNLTVVATSFLMEIFLTLISTALNLSTSIFFLSYCLWQNIMSQTEKEALLPALFLVSLLNLTLDNKSLTGQPIPFIFLNSSSQPLLCTRTRQLLLLEPIITHVYLLTLPNIS